MLQPKDTNPFDTVDEHAQGLAFAEKKRAIEQRTLDSTNKSLGLLYEAQEIGNSTAVELGKQREQLDKATAQLDEMNSTLRINKSQINNLKSVFGCVKNFLSGDKNKALTAANKSSRGVNSSTDNERSSTSAPLPSTEGYNNHQVSQLREDPNSTYHPQRQEANAFQVQIDANLEEIGSNLSVLKMLAKELGGEIESQNELLDNLSNKIEDVDLQVHKQNQDLTKLLKK
ncbi:synaptosomal-associated protein 29-like [Drosophila subpulchrella]|uniref:synaptosomal-associated protein 29-like n=1 Tax=Drosophila subpulchrella TaxID=1486046 RepID=UPI0018A144ED|nr:synaptosomal-associated protein 29-like [Drosophila subpulchrella]XP_037712717.1 synaptosomal-associated protein 29-like [Drosophila subpulchrella]XP_037712718.1 synaptosomal-associated protein 29-like [Drosophila subpulchrella]